MTDLVRPKNLGGRPLIYNSVEELKKDIDAYFVDCDAKKLPYTMSGLALTLGVDRKTILNYSDKEGFFHTIKNARHRVEQYAEQQLFIGKNQTGTIFNLKNNFGWKDEQQLSVQSNNTITHVMQNLNEKSDEYTQYMRDVTTKAKELTNSSYRKTEEEKENSYKAKVNTRVIKETERDKRKIKAKTKTKRGRRVTVKILENKTPKST